MNTVIIPTYCEQDNIAELKRRLPKDTKVLIVDDSPDEETAQAARDVGFEVLKREQKRGLSSAVIDGIHYTKADKIVVMDADLQHPPELVQKLFEALETHDLAIATRVKAEGWSLTRRVVSFIANLLAAPLCSRIKDRTTGFFGFRRSAVNPTSLNPVGWKICLEVAVKGHYNSVVQVPYDFALRTSGESKLSRKVVLEYVRQLVSLYLHKFRILKFMLVGASGTVVLLGALYLIEHFVLHTTFQSQWGAVIADKSYLVAFIPAFVLAAANNYLLNNLWTFSGRSAGKVGFPKYFLVASITLPLDLVLLYAFTEWCGLYYILSATLAIIIVFLIRYAVASKWIWRKLK